MSRAVVDRSPDLHRLWDEHYAIRVTTNNHLVVDRVPYVTPGRVVAHGRLVSKLDFTADGTAVTPVADHKVYFVGETPCDRGGQPLVVVNSSGVFELELGLTAQHLFSSKPANNLPYPDHYDKITSYVGMLIGHALALDPTVTATPGKAVLEDDPSDSPFVYRDTASTRAGIVVITDRLRLGKVAIVGLGGTGSYILDLVAKTPVGQIHLFDGDDVRVHNAFRSPGAATFEELSARPTKVHYLARRYSFLKRNVEPHSYAIDETTVEELRAMDFVFLSSEGGGVKRLIVSKLEEFGVPFIDVGLSMDKNGGSLGGMICVTTSTPSQRAHVHENGRIDFSEPGPDDDYDDNIQIADLNALNAVLAVIKWKKLSGFYRDSKREHFTAYTVERNHVVNEDLECPAP
jgi:hypothetical protein